MNPGRNDPCPCGSGKKYKKCCQGKVESRLPWQQGQANVAMPNGPAKGVAPTPAEFNQLAALFNAGHHAELESRMHSLLERYPDSGFAWKLLGVTLQMQGKDSLPALRKATELLPDDADAHYNQGNTLMGLGRLDEAETSYRRALQIRPDDVDAHYNLGNTLRSLGRLGEAESSYRRALQIRPDFAEVHGNLGNVMLEQGRLDEAEADYRRALQAKPGYVVAHYNLGNILHELGRLDEAEASYRRALQIRPDFAEAHCNLGKALHDHGHLPEAEASYRRALQINPNYAEVHSNLGNTLHDLDCLPEAEASYRRALQIRPDYAEVHSNLGNTLRDLGRQDEAEASYRKALQINPDYAEAHCNLGNILLELGRMDEAETSLCRALEIKPDFVKARLSLALARKVKADDENLAALIAVEEAARCGTTPLPDEEAMFMHFALGKSYDDIGDYDKAFPHFIEGCKLKRATFKHDPSKTVQFFTDLMRNFDAAAIDRLRGGGDPSCFPIFILGMPRSGTTLTEQIIASHPEVHGAGELRDLSTITWCSIDGVTFPDSVRLLDQARLTAWGAEYIGGLQRLAPDARRITDKMPENFFAVGLIHLMLPNAKIIHVNRNPVDTCLSCFTKLFDHKHEHTYELAELGRYYADYTRLMEHWRKVLPAGAFLDVRYEDIVADQEAQSRRLIEYCGLEWSDACLDFHKNKRAVRTASVTQVRQPIYKSSVERWRPYEKFLGPLFDALGELAPDRL
ncbi:MAG: tetratricopeptide repeat protein [Gallionellaceae bacterium]